MRSIQSRLFTLGRQLLIATNDAAVLKEQSTKTHLIVGRVVTQIGKSVETVQYNPHWRKFQETPEYVDYPCVQAARDRFKELLARRKERKLTESHLMETRDQLRDSEPVPIIPGQVPN
jgi:hypothetical protein